MEFPALKEAQEKLAAKSAELHKIFEEAGPTLDMALVKSLNGNSQDKVAEIKKLKAEEDELGAKVDELKGLGDIASSRRGEKGSESGEREHARGSDGAQLKSFGQLFVASKAYTGRSRSGGPEANIDVELKTLFETGNGWAPETTRGPRIVEYATRPVHILDIIPTGQTSQSADVYMQETVFTNNAAEIAEGGVYPESALKLEEVSEPVRKVGTWLPITDEQLEDVPRVRSYIDNRLPFMIRQRLGGQVLVGNGTAPNLKGILNRTGLQTQAKGADPTPDAFYKAMTKVMVVGQAMPNAHVMHPYDWQEIRLLRTADGIYIWGSPSDSSPARLWGLTVCLEQGLTEGTGLTGDFANFCELVYRRGIDIQISNSHNGYFTEGKQAVRADVRVALDVYRPAAFCQVTGV